MSFSLIFFCLTFFCHKFHLREFLYPHPQAYRPSIAGWKRETARPAGCFIYLHLIAPVGANRRDAGVKLSNATFRLPNTALYRFPAPFGLVRRREMILEFIRLWMAKNRRKTVAQALLSVFEYRGAKPLISSPRFDLSVHTQTGVSVLLLGQKNVCPAHFFASHFFAISFISWDFRRVNDPDSLLQNNHSSRYNSIRSFGVNSRGARFRAVPMKSDGSG